MAPFQITSISKNSLPLIYIWRLVRQSLRGSLGGIDLSMGALLLLSNVIA
ncbi:MAG: hypothetical protein R2867_40735 [Caldilineaceae bacterium]